MRKIDLSLRSSRSSYYATFRHQLTILTITDALEEENMIKFDLSLLSSRSSYIATFRHLLTILSNTDALDEEKWLNMLGTFVKDWFRYESHFVHGRDSLVDILKERGLLSESDAVQPLIGKKS